MIVFLKKGGDKLPQDVGEGADAQARISALKQMHGALAVVDANGKPVGDAPAAEPAKAAKKSAKKPASKKTAAKKRK